MLNDYIELHVLMKETGCIINEKNEGSSTWRLGIYCKIILVSDSMVSLLIGVLAQLVRAPR